MIISGKQFRKGVTNRSAPIDAFFPRTSIWKACRTGWVDTKGENTFAISFMDNDHIQINNNLLNRLGWSKKDSNSYLEIIDSYIHDGYIIDYAVKQSDSPKYYPRVISPYGKAIISPDSDNYEPLESLSSMYRYVIDLIKLEEQMNDE